MAIMESILIPMAGRGDAFVQAGYAVPKPFIYIDQQPMIQRVLDNLPTSGARVVLATLAAHYAYTKTVAVELSGDWESLDYYLLSQPTLNIAFTIHHARSRVERGDPTLSKPLLIAHSDQILDWSPVAFVDYALRSRADVVAVTVYPEELGALTTIDTLAEVYWFRQSRAVLATIERLLSDKGNNCHTLTLADVCAAMQAEGAKVRPYPVPRRWRMDVPSALQQAQHDEQFRQLLAIAEIRRQSQEEIN